MSRATPINRLNERAPWGKKASGLSSDLPPQIPPPIIGYTTAGAAEALGVATRTLRKRIDSGRVATVRIPLAKLVLLEEVERLRALGRGR